MRSYPAVQDVEAYLHQHIPLSADMGVKVIACNPAGVTLRAPLAPNINHRATVFGGSASAVAILAAWTSIHFALRAAGHTSRLVIQRNSMEYLAPIAGEFEAHCGALPAADFTRFLRSLDRHGKARLTLSAELHYHAHRAARFTGEYVALR